MVIRHGVSDGTHTEDGISAGIGVGTITIVLGTTLHGITHRGTILTTVILAITGAGTTTTTIHHTAGMDRITIAIQPMAVEPAHQATIQIG